MDGVNGVTQCPIAPKDYFVYKFNVTQYGSSWYHSHYSVQYADGATGPMTLHGPSSGNYDEAISPPLIMTDWGHNSAFLALYQGLRDRDILLNGRGNVTNFNNSVANTTVVKKPYNITFEGPVPGEGCKKYLLRVINTSFDTTFVFSIDNHWLQIVSTDFVPITPYWNTSVLVGIGQRYNVIVEARPEAYNLTTKPLPNDHNYWIRTYTTDCGNVQGVSANYSRTGILRYNKSSTADPSSEPWRPVSLACSDEDPARLRPILQWKVPDPRGEGKTESFDFSVQKPPNLPYPMARWTLSSLSDGWTPIRVNYSNPTFFHLDQKGDWDKSWRVVPADYTSKDWVSVPCP